MLEYMLYHVFQMQPFEDTAAGDAAAFHKWMTRPPVHRWEKDAPAEPIPEPTVPTAFKKSYVNKDTET